MNIGTFIGRVGRDAVVRHTQGGNAVTGWSLAVDVGYGERKTTLWLDCSLWGDRGTKVAEYITKGSQLGVSGEVGTKEYEGKVSVTLNVREVTLVGGQRQEPQRGGGAGQRGQAVRQQAQADDFADDSIPFVTNRSAW